MKNSDYVLGNLAPLTALEKDIVVPPFFVVFLGAVIFVGASFLANYVSFLKTQTKSTKALKALASFPTALIAGVIPAAARRAAPAPDPLPQLRSKSPSPPPAPPLLLETSDSRLSPAPQDMGLPPRTLTSTPPPRDADVLNVVAADAEAAAPPVDPAAAAMVFKDAILSTQREYIVNCILDPNQLCVTIAIVKSLVVMVGVAFYYTLEGGWDLYMLQSAAYFCSGELTYVVSITVTQILPSLDVAQRHGKGKSKVVSDDESLTGIVMDAVKDFLDVEDVSRIFVISTMIVVNGCLVLPPLFTHCLPGVVMYAWVFIVHVVGISALQFALNRFQELAVTERNRPWGINTDIFVCFSIKVAVFAIVTCLIQTSFLYATLFYTGVPYASVPIEELRLRSISMFIKKLQYGNIGTYAMALSQLIM